MTFLYHLKLSNVFLSLLIYMLQWYFLSYLTTEGSLHSWKNIHCIYLSTFKFLSLLFLFYFQFQCPNNSLWSYSHCIILSSPPWSWWCSSSASLFPILVSYFFLTSYWFFVTFTSCKNIHCNESLIWFSTSDFCYNINPGSLSEFLLDILLKPV